MNKFKFRTGRFFGRESADPMGKRQDIELLRIVSAFGIVWYHSRAKGHEFALSSLIIFAMLSMYLSGDGVGSFGIKIHKRYKRLLVPWIAWTVFYGVVNLLEGHRLFPAGNGIGSKMAVGTSVHLWYVPFIFVCAAAADAARLAFSRRAIGLFTGVALVAMLAATPWWRPASLHKGFPVALWAHASAAVLLGTFMSCSRDVGRTVTIAVMSLSLICAVLVFGYVDVGLPYVVGIVVGMVVLRGYFQRLVTVDVTYLSGCTFGIYLVHILFLDHLRLVYGVSGYALPLATFVLSTGSAALLRRYLPKYC